MKKYKRMFAFGCSFTKYAWYGWPEILAMEYNIPELHNLGMSAAGNQYIFNAFIQANNHFKFDEDDLVIICWSSILRKDTYKNGNWLVKGDVAILEPGTLYSREQLTYDFDEVGYALRDLALIDASQKILEGIECGWYNFAMSDIEDEWIKFPEASKIYNIFGSAISNVKSSITRIAFEGSPENRFNRDKKIHKCYSDGHPLPIDHLKYLNAVLGPLSKETQEKVLKYNKLVEEKIFAAAEEYVSSHFLKRFNTYVFAQLKSPRIKNEDFDFSNKNTDWAILNSKASRWGLID